jgi:diacylglycerol kinase (CTP)
MEEEKEGFSATRKDLHLTRRAFHTLWGLIIATLYLNLLDKEGMITLVGIVASALFVGENIRIKYPDLGKIFTKINNILYRDEEKFQISSSMPFLVSCLLVIFVFSKPIAIITVLFLGLGDPIAAIIGIKFGKRKISKNRTMEGCIAFFVVAFFICIFVMKNFYSGYISIILFAIVGAAAGTIAEYIETRLDDNITIPLFSAPLLALAWWLIFK